jgi:hypothetical protein
LPFEESDERSGERRMGTLESHSTTIRSGDVEPGERVRSAGERASLRRTILAAALPES